MRSMLFIALLATAPAAQAADTPAPNTASKTSVADDGDKMICRREPVIGSNVPGKRICKPKSQLLAEQAQARDAAKEMATPQGAGSSNN